MCGRALGIDFAASLLNLQFFALSYGQFLENQVWHIYYLVQIR